MIYLPRLFLVCALTMLAGLSHAAEPPPPQLPDWQVLEFEEKAFWATARSRLEILPDPGQKDRWDLSVRSSVVENSEELLLSFDSVTGRTYARSRVSKGKEQRMKSYRYETDFVLRERRNPDSKAETEPDQWPVTYSGEIAYPESAAELVVTSPYLLLPLAQELQRQGAGKSLTVLVHTDWNFYRVHLKSGAGIPIEADYSVTGGASVSASRETLAVALQVTADGTPTEDFDFSLLGLQEEIIIFFDRHSGLPLQVRGLAPRIGATEINLKSVTMRKSR